ncbi:MAG: HIT family protein, partial [Parcubacteria group bacterium]|nr:HIT family protein [Parcubacteria group bacterium]
MQDCVFCKIVSGDIPSHKVYEDESVLAFLDINPVNPGHTLVIPKAHHKDLLDIPLELGAKVMNAIQKIAPAVLAGVGADSFNLGVNNGSGAGQIVFHAHFHIMPRFAGDGHQLWH